MATARPARFWHPIHPWRGIRIDRTGRWPKVTFGWFTVEVIPPGLVAKVRKLLEVARTEGREQ